MSRDFQNSSVVTKDFYTYQSVVLGLGPSASANDSINIQADSDFILYKLSAFALSITNPAEQTAADRILAQVTIQITDTGSGRQIFEEPIPIPAIFGDGSLPFILPTPRRFASNSVISINYLNIQLAIEYNIYLSFIGTKVYTGR